MIYGNNALDKYREKQLDDYLDGMEDNYDISDLIKTCPACEFHDYEENWETTGEQDVLICPDCGFELKKE
jgi:hypothetical protein